VFAVVGAAGPAVNHVIAGEGFSCALRALGDAWCWGSNQFGMLGAGDRNDALTPRPVSSDVTFLALTASGAHACALAPGGAAYCWGQNASRELGAATSDICLRNNGSEIACSVRPVAVSGDLQFQSIDAGWRHNCALTAQGEAYCWGWNQFGQLGATTTETCLSDGVTLHACSTTPVPVSGGLRFKAISAGFWQTCGLTFDDQTLCWGNNVLGTFGNGSRAGSGPNPVPGAIGVTLRVLSSGAPSACGITSDRITVCWGGANAAGELGDGTNAPHLIPQPIVGDFVSVRSVNTMTENNFLAHVCGIRPEGETQCWGSNRRGQLGISTLQTCRFPGIDDFSCSNVPVAVAGDHRFRAVAAGHEHTCGATIGGDVLCWGRNDRGQLGDGTTTDRPEPVAVALP
jgi:alpha-tubulin suppressor-like RCC1 family protein